MAEHTPTPWICDSEGILPISRDGVSIVARIPNHPDNKANWDADAAFIVKTVNNHEEMDKLLAEAADYLNSHAGMDGMDLGNKITQFRRCMQADVGTVGTKP